MNLFVEKLALGPCSALPDDVTVLQMNRITFFLSATLAEQAPKRPVMTKHSLLIAFRSQFLHIPALAKSLLSTLNNAVGPGEEQIVVAINVRLWDDGPMHAGIIDPLYFNEISARRGVKSWH